MTADEIAAVLDRIAPRSLAESWDNPGWQVRLPSTEVTGILLAMEATEAVLAEASALGCNFLFTHHPAIFKPISSLDAGSAQGALLVDAARRGISIWSAHTNLDVMPDGTSHALARSLDLRDVELLSRVDRKDYKLVVYVPASHVEEVKNAMALAGAGRIGNYSSCFWEVLGTGQFKAEAGANPRIGRAGQLETVEEYRVEGVVPQSALGAVLEAMRRAHPYEEVAYDLLPLASKVSSFGYGAVGRLESPATTAEAARHAASTLSSAVCQVAGDPARVHERVAVVGGSGSTFIPDAIRSRATLFITADVRYHDAQDAVSKGLDLVILDHFATERPVLDVVRAHIADLLPGVPTRIAATPSTPYVRIEP